MAGMLRNPQQPARILALQDDTNAQPPSRRPPYIAVVSRDWISDSLAAGELQDCARCVPAE